MWKQAKRLTVILLAAVQMLFSGFISSSYACTSFAEYSDKILYGMNFDFPDTPVRLNFYEEDGLKIFYTQFKDGENFYMFCAMTNKGLFIPSQIQYPSLPAKDKLGENDISIGDLPAQVLPFERVSQVRELLKTKRLAPMSFPIHVMVADKFGEAMICEAGEEENQYVTVQDKFLVMTNFKHSDFIGTPYTEVIGTGADRYMKAYETITEKLDGFSIDNGWEVLKKTVQTNPSSQTLMSIIHDPIEGIVYFTLKRDFGKVWKVSLEEGSIETLSGFDQPYQVIIPKEGILSTELLKNPPVTPVNSTIEVQQNEPYGTIAAVFGAAILLLLPALLLLRRRQRR